MLENLWSTLDLVDELFWTYGGVPALLILGTYFSYKSKLFQIRKLPTIIKTFYSFFKQSKYDNRGVNPLLAFFASLGGCVGVGNIAGVCTAVIAGGPGAVFWMWVAAILGMLVKYGEIFLSIKFRQKFGEHEYIAGPITYLKRVAGGKILSTIVAVLLCLYGIEIYMFKAMTETISIGWGLDKTFVVFVLLLLTLGIGKGGVKLVGQVSSTIIPFFLVVFACMGLWIFAHNLAELGAVFKLIFSTAFTGHAAFGAFAGTTVILSMSQGFKRACYAGDIGIGYAGTIHGETSELVPAKQASMAIIEIILDSFIVCTTSVLLILVTGVWHEGHSSEMIVSHALGKYFNYIDVIWPFFIFLLAYSTLIAFYAVGQKACNYLFPKIGCYLYPATAVCAFLFFAFFGKTSHALAIMSMTGMLLLIINLYGMVSLLDEVDFNLPDEN